MEYGSHCGNCFAECYTRCVTNALFVATFRTKQARTRSRVHGYSFNTGTRLDGYAPKIWPQMLASTRGGDSQIWRVLVGREYLQGDNSTVHSTRQHVGKWEVRKAVSILARNVINRLLIPKLLWGTPCPTQELDRDPKLVT